MLLFCKIFNFGSIFSSRTFLKTGARLEHFLFYTRWSYLPRFDEKSGTKIYHQYIIYLFSDVLLNGVRHVERIS